MSYNLIGKRSVPEGPYDYALVSIPREAIPFVVSAIRIKQAKYWWNTDEDTKRANDLLTRFKNGLLMNWGIEIVNAINKQTVMQRSVFLGVETLYNGVGTEDDPFIFDPPIMPASYPSELWRPSLMGYAKDTAELTHNLVDGTATTLTAETRNFRDMLQEQIDNSVDPTAKLEELKTVLTAILALL